jgi:hypothetical protein
MQKKFILPVVHHLDYKTSIKQGALALSAGADGIFLISHNGRDDDLFGPSSELKERFPDRLIGLNLLDSRALVAMSQVRAAGLDMIWADSPGITSTQTTGAAREIAHLLAAEPAALKFFGSVAFKYQPLEPDPANAARLCWQLRMIPTTSGTATGEAPPIEKVASMRQALGIEAPLAIASGMTPENVATYLPYVTHFLVATGVSLDEYHFNSERLDNFIRAVRG